MLISIDLIISFLFGSCVSTSTATSASTSTTTSASASTSTTSEKGTQTFSFPRSQRVWDLRDKYSRNILNLTIKIPDYKSVRPDTPYPKEVEITEDEFDISILTDSEYDSEGELTPEYDTENESDPDYVPPEEVESESEEAEETESEEEEEVEEEPGCHWEKGYESCDTLVNTDREDN